MKKLFCLVLIFPLLINAQSQKKYPSLLWKISGNGLKKPSYLYGTMHVSNRVAYYLSEQFFDALKNVDVVGLETNPGEWLENMERTGELSELNQSRTPNYGQDFYKSIFTVSFPEKRILQGILSYDPDIIDGLLYRQNRSKENFEESTYIDLFIYQSASKLNKQVISLESFAMSEIKARLSAIPDEDNGDAAKNYNAYYSSSQKIEDAYRDGNLDQLDSLSKLVSSKNTQRYLINDRNVFFVNTIDSVLKTHSLFSGVGAAHLPGEDGVIELLRKKGYTVEPVIPKVTKKSNNRREELDLMVKPVAFKKQFASDSSFSVNLPGKLYPIVNLENLKYYIHADMVNGSFYTVVRLKHLGPLFNVGPEHMMQKMDSLLFEHIPGKILTKKEITASNGLKGLEIVNRIRRGDEQHYQVFFSDLEMILFKLGGKQQYATGSEARQFFNSIQFNQKSQAKVSYSPRTKGYAVNIPGNYSYMKSDGGSLSGMVEDLFAFDKQQKQCFGIKHAVYNDFSYLEEDTFELNQLAKNVLINFNYTLSPQREIKAEQGFPCIRLSAKNNAGNFLAAKVFIKGVHYYLVYTTAKTQPSFDTDYFTSFRLCDFEYVNPLKLVTDKDCYFKAIDEVTDNALSRFNDAYAKAFEVARVKKDSAKKDYDFRTTSKLYYSPSSNEYVNISLEKYNDYDYRNIKELPKKIGISYKNAGSMILTGVRTGTADGLFTYSCTLRDTATTRAVQVKVFFRYGYMQEIACPYDTTIGLRGWAKGFMESFTPLDTMVGKNIFADKFEQLVADLCSNDTVRRQAANNSVKNSISLDKEYADRFVKFIGSEKFAMVNDDSRAQLLVNGGTLENEKIIAPYKKLYKQYTDSFYLQLCVLKGLACLKTPASFSAFNSLLLAEPPLVGAENTINDVFAVLHDSLELCRGFFPSMLSLTRYDEYRDAVYALLAALVTEQLLSPQVYLAQKDQILDDANLAVKRYSPSSNKSAGTADFPNNDNMEKAAREIAESIRLSLEGLATNNQYKGSPLLKSIESVNRAPLVNYALILSPYYKKEEKVRQLMTKLAKTRNQGIVMPVTINLLKQDVLLNDTLVKYYSKNKFTRAYFYSELEKEKLTAKFDKQYLSQLSLVESVISSQKQLNNYYGNDREKSKKDSLVLLKEMPAQNKYQKGKMYVYRLVKVKNDDEQWCAVFVNGSKELTSKMEIVSGGYFVDKNKSEQENLNDLLDYFALGYRKRAGNANATYD